MRRIRILCKRWLRSLSVSSSTSEEEELAAYLSEVGLRLRFGIVAMLAIMSLLFAMCYLLDLVKSGL